MKKQFFLLSLLLAPFYNVSNIVADCDKKCETSCATDSCSSSNCVPEHGHTFMSIAPEFGAASPERVSLFESSKLKNLKHNDKHGAVQVVLFGGKNTKGNRAAGYYLPYGHTQLTFDGSVKPATFAAVLAESDVKLTGTPANTDEIVVGNSTTIAGGAPTTILTDAATYQFDNNKDTSKILPWNFGITYAALFDSRGASVSGGSLGTGLITNPDFKSTINPCLRRWHIGAGVEFAYHFSEDADGWFAKMSTAVQHVRSRINLNENPAEPTKTKLDSSLPAGNSQGTPAPAGTTPGLSGANGKVFPATAKSTVTPVGQLKEAYLGLNDAGNLRSTGFPVDTGTPAAPASVTEAFNQDAWKYGKIGCEQRITRLADIELSIGRLWTCGDCASTSWDLGVVIPTGNNPCAEYVAPAVVGNGKHAAIRMGSTTAIMLSESDEMSTWFRMDVDSRYLFRKTQKRSFDLKNKEWSRYMMVWENKDAYSSALTNFITPVNVTNALPQRGYTPGINVFTTDFYIKPKFQGRLNSAVSICGERFKAELGWNVHARTKECVELACPWDAAPAFADSSYIGGLALNNNRTIFNDSQTTATNVVNSRSRGFTLDNTALLVLPFPNPGAACTPAVATAAARYDDFVITDADINYDSVASASSIAHTPYLTLGYAFDYECAPVIGLGASYEFTASNTSLNQWMVWGKFECAF